jgi:nucleoside-diphosphate-sugar epimerase
MHFTILGAQGFIGSNLVSSIRHKGVECNAPAREEHLAERDLGHVIYCIGLTADFRTRIFDTVEAHVCKLLDILRNCRYDSFLYLSSTRVYKNAQSTDENTMLMVNPLNAEDIYNISKLMGESLCLNVDNPSVRVVRVSNVIGPDSNSYNFVNALIARALDCSTISLEVSLDSEKDYIAIEDVVELLPHIALKGKQRIYNIASGINVTHGQIVSIIGKLINYRLEIREDAPRVVFPLIDVSRIVEEFQFSPSDIKKSIEQVIDMYGGGKEV